jgi:hypothetical protein
MGSHMAIELRKQCGVRMSKSLGRNLWRNSSREHQRCAGVGQAVCIEPPSLSFALLAPPSFNSFDGIDADQNLALKTRFDYRKYAEDYIRPYLGNRRVRDITLRSSWPGSGR